MGVLPIFAALCIVLVACLLSYYFIKPLCTPSHHVMDSPKPSLDVELSKRMVQLETNVLALVEYEKTLRRGLIQILRETKATSTSHREGFERNAREQAGLLQWTRESLARDRAAKVHCKNVIAQLDFIEVSMLPSGVVGEYIVIRLIFRNFVEEPVPPPPSHPG